MEYTYEFLKKCHGLRFRATLGNKPQEGIIKVTSEGVMLCYGEEDPGYLVTFGRRDTLSFSEQTFSILPSDFEIVPRDPETYKDWHVGDKIAKYSRGRHREVIFRSGEVVIYKLPINNEEAFGPYTCGELFGKGFRLVLTDIEKQIIEEREKAEWKPQDGDIVAWKSKEDNENPAISIYKEKERCYATIYADGSTEYSIYTVFAMNIIRPATYDETQRLFDAMEKDGKRWNAEKKAVEDIPKPYEFRKGEPVLVRNDSIPWACRVYVETENGFYATTSAGTDRAFYRHCIPYNEKTMHLLGTNDDYEEEQS